MVMVNLPTAGVEYHVPSADGKPPATAARAGGYAAEFYTTVKTTYIAP
jgi:aldehyde dehydrogenase (NAD+)